MIEAVFISDLHLHPEYPNISEYFTRFINWVVGNTREIYILGDLFHAWAGDDLAENWAKHIALQLLSVKQAGIRINYIHGNRDFLVGNRFADLAGIELLFEPTLITLGQQRVLLMHGDSYCTNDRWHQWLRFFTRNSFFPKIFLSLPREIRLKMVSVMRDHSQGNYHKSDKSLELVVNSMISHMQRLQVRTIVHGHTHKPGLTVHQRDGKNYSQYVLSDWDDKPVLLCYHKTNGFYFDTCWGE
ncbi:MAG: UDP-2,3-diacylglucosamine diphosphatase [Legionella sp.]